MDNYKYEISFTWLNHSLISDCADEPDDINLIVETEKAIWQYIQQNFPGKSTACFLEWSVANCYDEGYYIHAFSNSEDFDLADMVSKANEVLAPIGEGVEIEYECKIWKGGTLMKDGVVLCHDPDWSALRDLSS